MFVMSVSLIACVALLRHRKRNLIVLDPSTGEITYDRAYGPRWEP